MILRLSLVENNSGRSHRSSYNGENTGTRCVPETWPDFLPIFQHYSSSIILPAGTYLFFQKLCQQIRRRPICEAVTAGLTKQVVEELRTPHKAFGRCWLVF